MENHEKRIVGIDFDNTLINYDQVFYQCALNLKLISPQVNKNKKEVRDTIRLLKDGETIWQKLQALVYGKEIAQAFLNGGADVFLRSCTQHGIKVYIVSHKTEFSNLVKDRVNIRHTALGWMVNKHFFGSDGLGLNKDQVYFESTRLEKISRIRSLGCTHFIDDLEEVFLEKDFPENVKKLLYAPHENPGISGDMKVFKDWKKIHEYFFN